MPQPLDQSDLTSVIMSSRIWLFWAVAFIIVQTLVIVSLGVNIIARRKAERLALERQARIKALAEIASDWFWSMDENLRFSYFSQRFEEVTGVPPSLLLGKTREETGIPGIDKAIWQEHLATLAAHEPFTDFIHPRIRPDGTTIWLAISGHPQFDSNGGFTGYLGAGRTVTQLIEAERKFKEQYNLLRGILNNAPTVISFRDTQGRYLLVNKAFEQTFGVRDEDVRGVDYRLLFSAKDAASITEHEERVFRTRKAQVLEHEIDTLQGRSDMITVRFPVFDDDDEIYAIGTITTEITKLKQAERELMRAKIEAQTASRAKSQFLATMSHELRTPLNAILGFSEVMHLEALGPLQNPRYKEYAKDITSSARHLLSLINDILDLTKIENEKLNLSLESLAAREEAEKALHELRQAFDQKQIGLSLKVQASLPAVLADRRALRQALSNLLSNALKFTPIGGSVSLAIAEDGQGKVDFCVCDSGCGIPANRIDELGQPFHQIGDLLTAETQGTGLGLAITKQLVERMGGKVTIVSQLGEGSDFTISLPAALEEQAEQNKAQALLTDQRKSA